MSGGVTAGEADRRDAEIAGAGLPDQRLKRRLRRLLDQLSSAPGQPVPAACGDWAATKAAYRFFDNPRVTEHGVLAARHHDPPPDTMDVWRGLTRLHDIAVGITIGTGRRCG